MTEPKKILTKEDALRIRKQYPKRIPVICTLAPKSNLPPLDKNQYLVSEELSVGQFAYVIRKRLTLKPEQALFIMCGNTFPSTQTDMIALYEEHKAEDHFLYLQVSGENVFG